LSAAVYCSNRDTVDSDRPRLCVRASDKWLTSDSLTDGLCHHQLARQQKEDKSTATVSHNTCSCSFPLMSDVSSSTPSLTPQSTGTQDSSPRAPTRKSRPQAAFYPNVNAATKEQKPFSRSAAKRESVMALGSIEHLQHYFTKTGLIAKKECVCRALSAQLPPNSHSGPTLRERALSPLSGR
jgi:hypothetical protein